MDWGFMQTILTVIFGITSMVLAIYTILRAKQKKPVWAYETTKVTGLGTNAPPELKLIFNSKPVNDVYQTILILFIKEERLFARVT